MSIAITVLAALALAAWATFAVLYHVRAAWFATEQGRNIMGVSVALALFLALAVAARLWPEATWLDGVRLVTYLWLAYLGVQRAVQMVRLQRATRAAHKAVISHLGDRTP